MPTFTTDQVLALVGAARRDDDEGGSDGGGGGGPTEDPTPMRSDVPEPVLAAAKALSDNSGCKVTCSTLPPGDSILCVISECPKPGRIDEPADPERSELDELLLRLMVEEAGKAGRGIRLQRDSDPRKPNDPVERIDRRLALQEALAAAFGDLLEEASPDDLAAETKDA
jgi:hypothetical protein